MDTYLTIASLRVVRSYSDRTIPPETIDRILDAGRITGSAYNDQPWRFIVIQDPQTLRNIAPCVNRPSNVSGCALAIAVLLTEDTTLTRFDAGRCVQNMVLAAWNEGIGSSPNYVKDPDRFEELLDVQGNVVDTVLSFGYPDPPVDPSRRPAEAWLRTTDRKPKEETVSFV